jgi:hypothetical protein
MLGWYWIPGNVWGPGWVSWAYGGNYVGWCPLGYRDKPVPYGGRRAVPRGTLAVTDEPWVYVQRADFSASDLATKIQLTVPPGEEMHPLQQPHARPDRNLHAALGGTETHTGPRGVKTRPGHGEAAAQPGADTAIPFPTARRPHRETGDEAALSASPAAPAAPRPRTVYRPRTVTTSPDPGRPADARSPEPRAPDADREVLRRVFGPLSQPRPAEPAERGISHPLPSAESGRSSRPRPGAGEAAPPRAEPRAPRPTAEPPPGPAGSDAAHGATRPRKDKDH